MIKSGEDILEPLTLLSPHDRLTRNESQEGLRRVAAARMDAQETGGSGVAVINNAEAIL